MVHERSYLLGHVYTNDQGPEEMYYLGFPCHAPWSRAIMEIIPPHILKPLVMWCNAKRTIIVSIVLVETTYLGDLAMKHYPFHTL